ncbi:Importin subunit alpha-3 [Thelohanellus kitauei]|uniref:Importin subunit alpha n=1 Tax=Thelohanellus kitauei TaxID=669202 RepID=A0A0C2N9K9_THEKT|nr:Importin subunit alpha-3 [Thelohanellus kitauei]
MEIDEPSLGHSKLFKNCGKNFDSVRRDRISQTIELRKDKRDEMLRKRRNEPLLLPDKFDRAIITSIDHVAKLVQECASSNRDVAYQAVFNLRLHLSSKHELYLDKLLELNIVDILVPHLVNGETADVKYNAAWALTNIASGDSQHTSFLLKESVIMALGSLLCDANPSLVEQSIWALANIIGDGPVPREFVLRSNILSILNQPLNQHYNSIPVMKQLSWMLINICRRKDVDVPIEYVPQIIPILDVLISHKDENILGDVLWSITHLADSSSNHVSLLIASGIVDKVYKFLGVSQKLTLSTLRVLGNIAASVDEHTQYLLDHGIFVHLQPLLNTTNQKLKKEIYWVLSNFAAGTRPQMLTLFSLNIFPQIIQDLEEGEYAVRREACWVISNVVHGSTYQEVQPFVESKVLYFMKNFLETRDPPMIVVVLEVVLILLRLYSAHNNQEYMCQKIEESGVLDCIENLQTSSHKSIRLFAIHILENHFAEDQDQDVEEEEITYNYDQTGLSNAPNKYDF